MVPSPNARSIADVRELFARASGEALVSLVEEYAHDPRSGVEAILRSARARLDRLSAEERRLDSLYRLETTLRANGLVVVAGVDEVGRGALAGPLTAGACVLPEQPRIHGLDDSKKLTPRRRQELDACIREVALGCAVAHVPACDVDRLGVTRALRRAMREALGALPNLPEHVIVDGLPLGIAAHETAVVKGDSHVAAIAAASIIAKVERDALMVSLAGDYPHYGFEINKGYGTAEHMDAIRVHGPSPIHRMTFSHGASTATLF